MCAKALMAALLFFLASSVAHARSGKEPPEVERVVDLKRYAGLWYEIARLPNRFEKSCAGDVTANYTLLESGEIEVVNQCRKRGGEMKRAKGRARLAERGRPTSKLKVRFAPSFLSFLPFVWGDYWIIELAEDYSYAVVGDPSRDYLWILARNAKIDDAVYQKLIERAAAKGFDTSRLIKTAHTL